MLNMWTVSRAYLPKPVMFRGAFPWTFGDALPRLRGRGRSVMHFGRIKRGNPDGSGANAPVPLDVLCKRGASPRRPPRLGAKCASTGRIGGTAPRPIRLAAPRPPVEATAWPPMRPAATTPRHREAARRPHARAAKAVNCSIFGCLVRCWCSRAIRLFFSCAAFCGPPSGNCCRLRRHPASRRRSDAPPVDGLDVRRSVSC